MHGHESVPFIPNFYAVTFAHPAVERQNEGVLGHRQENLPADLIIHWSSSGALWPFLAHNSAEAVWLRARQTPNPKAH